jgi:hypothetical protein
MALRHMPGRAGAFPSSEEALSPQIRGEASILMDAGSMVAVSLGAGTYLVSSPGLRLALIPWPAVRGRVGGKSAHGLD